MAKEVDRLLATWDTFVVPLRLRDGYSEAAYSDLADALATCAHSWRDKDAIPRRAANVLVDIVPALEALYYAYEGEPEAEKIREAQATLQESIWQCVAIDPE